MECIIRKMTEIELHPNNMNREDNFCLSMSRKLLIYLFERTQEASLHHMIPEMGFYTMSFYGTHQTSAFLTALLQRFFPSSFPASLPLLVLPIPGCLLTAQLNRLLSHPSSSLYLLPRLATSFPLVPISPSNIDARFQGHS
jgi:hypothetical protein